MTVFELCSAAWTILSVRTAEKSAHCLLRTMSDRWRWIATTISLRMRHASLLPASVIRRTWL